MLSQYYDVSETCIPCPHSKFSLAFFGMSEDLLDLTKSFQIICLIQETVVEILTYALICSEHCFQRN